jgi:4'-phosphopantetheinyl transferase EntD
MSRVQQKTKRKFLSPIGASGNSSARPAPVQPALAGALDKESGDPSGVAARRQSSPDCAPLAGQAGVKPGLQLKFAPPGPPFTLVAIRQGHLETSGLHPEEASLLRGNVAEKRRTEFALGRTAARQALRELGLGNPPPVLQKAGREPSWPQGIVGSITHCGSWALAAVARSKFLEGLGIDLEDVEAVPHQEIADLVCRAPEREWVFQGGDSRLKLAMLFSAKESAYKALHPLCRRFFDFHGVELTWSPQRGIFRGVLCVRLNRKFPKGYSFEVSCQRSANFVFTHVILKARGAGPAGARDRSMT